jgi:polygalacturonase
LILEEEGVIVPRFGDSREHRQLDMDVESSSQFTVNGDGSVQMAGAPDAAADAAPVAQRGGGAVGVVVEGSHR